MEQRLKALTAARLIDGTGGPPLEDPVVILRGERIAAVGARSATPIPPEAEVVDLGPSTLLPGLVDAHAHFYVAGNDNWVLRSIEPSQRKLIRAVADAANLLQAGFTAVRDMGYRDTIYLKQAIDAGEIAGPRLVAPRMMIIQTGGSPDPYWLPVEWVERHDYRCRLADGVDEVRRAAREQLREGADFLKVMASGGLGERKALLEGYHYTLEELRAIVEEGHKVGVKVAAHAIGPAAIKVAVRAGVDSIEHGSFADAEALDLMAERDVIFVPTLAISYAIVQANMAGTASRALDVYEAGLARVQRARELGIRVAAGCDFGGLPSTRHGRNALEAELLVVAGMAPAEAVVATTRRGAEAMARQEELGTVQPGRYADLVATDGNPLEDIRALGRVSFVMKGGEVVRRAEMGSLVGR